MKDRASRTFIALFVVVAMLITSIGFAMAEPYHVLSGRDKVGTYGQDGKSARMGYLNTVAFEGDTSDTNKTYLYATDPTGRNLILLPDSSGTVSLTSGAFSGTLEDTKIYIGNSGDIGVAQSIGTGHSLTNAGALTHIANTVSSTDILNGTILSADIAIANVQASNMFMNTVTVTVAAGQTGSSTAVEAGSLLIGWLPVSGISNTFVFNSVSYVGGNLLTNTSAHTGSMIGNAVFIRP